MRAYAATFYFTAENDFLATEIHDQLSEAWAQMPIDSGWTSEGVFLLPDRTPTDEEEQADAEFYDGLNAFRTVTQGMTE